MLESKLIISTTNKIDTAHVNIIITKITKIITLETKNHSRTVWRVVNPTNNSSTHEQVALHLILVHMNVDMKKTQLSFWSSKKWKTKENCKEILGTPKEVSVHAPWVIKSSIIVPQLPQHKQCNSVQFHEFHSRFMSLCLGFIPMCSLVSLSS